MSIAITFILIKAASDASSQLRLNMTFAGKAAIDICSEALNRHSCSTSDQFSLCITWRKTTLKGTDDARIRPHSSNKSHVSQYIPVEQRGSTEDMRTWVRGREMKPTRHAMTCIDASLGLMIIDMHPWSLSIMLRAMEMLRRTLGTNGPFHRLFNILSTRHLDRGSLTWVARQSPIANPQCRCVTT